MENESSWFTAIMLYNEHRFTAMEKAIESIDPVAYEKYKSVLDDLIKKADDKGLDALIEKVKKAKKGELFKKE